MNWIVEQNVGYPQQNFSEISWGCRERSCCWSEGRWWEWALLPCSVDRLVSSRRGPPYLSPWRHCWVSKRFSFSWPPEQTAITVSIVSSSPLGAKPKFREHVLETNIWQPGSPLGVTLCLCLFPIKTLLNLEIETQCWTRLLLKAGFYLWLAH